MVLIEISITKIVPVSFMSEMQMRIEEYLIKYRQWHKLQNLKIVKILNILFK